MDVMQKADVINFPLHSSLGLHIRGPWCWRTHARRADGGYLLTELEVLKAVLLLFSGYLSLQSSVFVFSLSAIFNNSPSGCGTCLGHAWVPPPHALLLLPNLPSSGDRNELPTTIGAATVWWRGCRLPQGANTPWNWRSESVTPLPSKHPQSFQAQGHGLVTNSPRANGGYYGHWHNLGGKLYIVWHSGPCIMYATDQDVGGKPGSGFWAWWGEAFASNPKKMLHFQTTCFWSRFMVSAFVGSELKLL